MFCCTFCDWKIAYMIFVYIRVFQNVCFAEFCAQILTYNKKVLLSFVNFDFLSRYLFENAE